MKNEIPRWGWYNGQFIQQYSLALKKNPNQSISDFMSEFKEKNLNNIEFPLINQGLTISLLYVLLVVPQQLWRRNNIQITQDEIKNLFNDIDTCDQYNNESFVDSFIRHMRNSISHARFEMN